MLISGEELMSLETAMGAEKRRAEVGNRSLVEVGAAARRGSARLMTALVYGDI